MNGFKDFKNHLFFKDFPWDKLKKMELESPDFGKNINILPYVKFAKSMSPDDNEFDESYYSNWSYCNKS